MTGELKEFGLSLTAIVHLLSCVDMDDLFDKTEQLELGEIDDLIVGIPKRDGYDD